MDDRRQPFPADALGFTISATSAASASQALPAVANDVRIVNEGPNHAFLHLSTGTAVAAVPAVGSSNAARTGTEVLAGSDVGLSLPSSTVPCNISAICAGSGTATLRIYVGEGL